MSARTERLHSVLQMAEIAAEVHPHIRVAIWQKFLFICAFSGVTALTRVPIGAILADPVTHDLFRGTVEEAEAVARQGNRAARGLRRAGVGHSRGRRALGAWFMYH